MKFHRVLLSASRKELSIFSSCMHQIVKAYYDSRQEIMRSIEFFFKSFSCASKLEVSTNYKLTLLVLNLCCNLIMDRNRLYCT